MKKLLKIVLIFMIILITMLCTKTFAANESLSGEVEIVTPEAGIYGEGQEVTIRFTFNKKIKGVMPKYSIYFGYDATNKIELETNAITELTNVVEYKYTIKSGDNGELRPNGFVNTTSYLVEDENGNQIYLNDGYIFKFEQVILADTTVEWTDLSKATVEMISPDTGNNAFFELVFKNCTLNTENDYYVHFSHDKNENIIVKNKDEVYDNNVVWQTMVNPVDNKIYLNEKKRDMFAEKGEVYATVCEIDKNTGVPKIVLRSFKITRLGNLPLTQRITANFYSEQTSTFCWDIHSENQKNLNYKVGQVKDLNLLKAIKNGEASSLPDLMEYAKKSEAIGTGTIKLGKDSTITDKLNLIDDEYYYVYLQLDSVDGKYVALEDVSLYQALIGESAGKNLLSMTDKDFKWNLDETVVFSDFSNAKATISNFRFSTENPSSNNLTFVVWNVKSNAQKKHKFYFYVSNDTQNIPEHDSELWMAVDKFEINEETGECIIYTTNILDLPYIEQIDLNNNVYISIYEVISDNEITSEKIDGTYKLGLNSKIISLDSEEGKTEDDNKVTEKEDNTTATGKLPQTGLSICLSVSIVVLLAGCAYVYFKYSKLKGI